MKISCEKAQLICAKAQYDEASFIEKIRLKLHIFACEVCEKHSIKNTKLTSMCNNLNLKFLSEEDKESMKEKLNCE